MMGCRLGRGKAHLTIQLRGGAVLFFSIDHSLDDLTVGFPTVDSLG
jgi:hypothetical protein